MLGVDGDNPVVGRARTVDCVMWEGSGQTLPARYDGLPEAEQYCTDGYGGYGMRPADRHVVGKGRAVKRNEGFHSRLRSRLI